MIKQYIAYAVAALICAAVAWVFLIYGPSQHRAGSNAAQVRLDDATNKAAKGISNDADRYRFLLDQCTLSGGVFDYTNGECKR